MVKDMRIKIKRMDIRRPDLGFAYSLTALAPCSACGLLERVSSNFHDYCTLESACVYNSLVYMFVANSVKVD